MSRLGDPQLVFVSYLVFSFSLLFLFPFFYTYFCWLHVASCVAAVCHANEPKRHVLAATDACSLQTETGLG